jgi:hypothetical protein
MENMNNNFLIIAFPDFMKLVSIKTQKISKKYAGIRENETFNRTGGIP